eukprot:TRINITY_DN6183_c0_g1_i2.p2 TRINITY_DN6183_c0_g1~~TRINITY_DN6183_c0_g1_i2.p2  ORF type:complete len:103 (+),score=3.77 TRINITY_DN6183_c0_g1_i2:141-449(+)
MAVFSHVIPKHLTHHLPSPPPAAQCFQSLSLHRVSLCRVSLRRVSLRRVSLRRVSLRRVSLRRVSLHRVSLRRAQVVPCVLELCSQSVSKFCPWRCVPKVCP